jgi:hypothetical protein
VPQEKRVAVNASYHDPTLLREDQWVLLSEDVNGDIEFWCLRALYPQTVAWQMKSRVKTAAHQIHEMAYD